MSFDQLRRREFITLVGGAAAGWPLAGRAQQLARVPTIGVLMPLTENDPEGRTRQAAFEAALKEAGYVKGQNLAIDYRWVAAQFDRLPALAGDLVRRQVDVIVTPGSSVAALAAKAATTTIPVVFSTSGDPVEQGLVTSLNSPGGNLTGASYLNSELGPKRLGLLREMVPGIDLVGVLVPSGSPSGASVPGVETAAREIGLRTLVRNVVAESEIAPAFADLAAQRAGAVVVINGNFFTLARAQIIELAERYTIPAIYPSREYVEGGGLMSYAASLTEAYRLVGLYTGRILKGAKPTDLPVQQSTKIELVINLKTVKALGLAVPPSLLAIADEVIE
jgi:putative tryptophan/tyrosine transport system substrate-binding protein